MSKRARSGMVLVPAGAIQIHGGQGGSNKGRPAAKRAKSSGAFYIGQNRGINGRYSSNAFRKSGEVKTLDIQFTGGYAAAYTADTQPAQQLNTNSGTACVQAITLVQQGAGISQRIGNKISLKSLKLRLFLQPNTGNTQGPVHYCRIMVIYDRNPNAAYVAANNILSESLQSNTIATGSYYDDINPNYFERFSVLMNETIALPPFDPGVLTNSSTTGPTEQKEFIVERYIKLRDLECIYSGTANPMTIAYSTVGSLQILTYGDTAAANTAWCLYGGARLRFRDN